MVGIRHPLEAPTSPAVNRAEITTNLAGLGLLAYGILTTGDIDRHGGMALAAALLAVCAAAWAIWLGTRARSDFGATRAGTLAVMAVGGGALVGVAPLAMVFGAVASMGAAIAWPFRRAGLVALAALASSATSVPLAGRPWSVALGALSAVLAGVIIGVNRRVAHERSLGAAAVALARAQADAEAARAELLAGRNHLARELHDVLAHTLSAVSVQLEVLGAQLGDADAAVTAKLEEVKRLLRDGLDEARGAVAALREDLPPLDRRLQKLAAQRDAHMELAGDPRPLPADVSLALYRVAQEALTNAAKHAPGSAARLQVTYAAGSVTVSVSNTPGTGEPGAGGQAPAGPVQGAGGGYGLQGIRERVLLIGGTVEAGPAPEGGWRVLAHAPA